MRDKRWIRGYLVYRIERGNGLDQYVHVSDYDVLCMCMGRNARG